MCDEKKKCCGSSPQPKPKCEEVKPEECCTEQPKKCDDAGKPPCCEKKE